LNEGVETSGISAFYGTNNLRTLVLPSTYDGKIELPMISKENAKPTLFMKPEYIEDAGLIIRRGPGYDGKRFEEEQNEILNIKIKRGNKNFEFNMKRGEQPIIEIQQNLIEIRCINQPQVISIDCNQLEQGIYNIQNGTIEIQKSQSFQGQSEKGEIIMDKKKQKIIYEAILVHNAFNNELTGYSDNEYSRYHQQNADWYRGFSSRFNQILGFTGQTTEEFITYVSMADLTPEQKKP